LSRVRRRVASTVLRGVRRSNAPHLPDSHQPTMQRERAMKRFHSAVVPNGSCPRSPEYHRTSNSPTAFDMNRAHPSK
jgi:hypothetical protein